MVVRRSQCSTLTAGTALCSSRCTKSRRNRLHCTPLNLFHQHLISWFPVPSQVRWSHTKINALFARFRSVDSPICLACSIPETLSHSPFIFRSFTVTYRVFRRTAGGPMMWREMNVNTKSRTAWLDFVGTSNRFEVRPRPARRGDPLSLQEGTSCSTGCRVEIVRAWHRRARVMGAGPSHFSCATRLPSSLLPIRCISFDILLIGTGARRSASEGARYVGRRLGACTALRGAS